MDFQRIIILSGTIKNSDKLWRNIFRKEREGDRTKKGKLERDRKREDEKKRWS